VDVQNKQRLECLRLRFLFKSYHVSPPTCAQVREDFLRPPAQSVTYADAASIATGKTGGTGADKFGGDDKSTRSEKDGSDDGEDSDGEGDNEDEEEAAAARLRHFSSVDMRRLWAIDTIVGALRNPAVPLLRQQAAVSQFMSFLALHAFADVSVPAVVLDAADAEDAVSAAVAPSASTSSSSKAGAKRNRALSASANPEVAALRSFVRAVGASEASASVRSSASLLVADPPISEPLREELRARLLTLLHELPKQQLGTGVGGQRRGSAAAGVAAKPAAEVPPQLPLPPAWNKCQDRVSAMLQMQVDMATRVQEVWAATVVASSASGAADGSALVATAFPTVDALQLAQTGDNDSSSSDEDNSDDESSSSGESNASGARVAPALLRTAALDASRVLRDLAATVLQHGFVAATHTSESGGRHRITEAARQLLAYAALLSHGALQMLLSPGDSTIATAVADVLGCAPMLQGDALTTSQLALRSAMDREAAGGSSGVAASTPGKKKGGGKQPPRVESGTPPLAIVSAAVTPVLASIASLADLASPYSAAGSESAAASEALLVLVDAALALLSNAGTTMREVVKAALRPLFIHVTLPVIDAILRIISASREDDQGELGSDGDGGGIVDGSDAESITLASSSLLAPFTDVESGGTTAAATKSDDDDSDAEASAGRGAAEMEKYDRMLSNMLRMRKHVRTAASQNRRRALHFKFRALALLDAAVSCLAHADTTTPGAATRQLQLTTLSFPVPMLRTARVLAARARGQSSDTDSSAGDSAALLARMVALLGRVIKHRVPVLAPSTPEAGAALFGFAEALALAQRAPSPDICRAAEGVAVMLLRALRVGGSSAGDVPNSGGSIAAQVAPAFVRPVVDAYAQLLERHFAGKRSNIGANFLRNALMSMPVVAVRLLPILAGIVAEGRVAKVFRLHEGVLLLSAMVRSSSASWASGVACDIATAAFSAPASARKKQKAPSSALTAGLATVTVAAVLSSAVPVVLRAVSAVISCAAGRTDGVSPAAVSLPVKQAKDAIALVTQLYKSSLIVSGSAGDEIDTLFIALGEFVRIHGNKHGVLQQASRCFELAGRDVPELPTDRDVDEAPSSTGLASAGGATGSANVRDVADIDMAGSLAFDSAGHSTEHKSKKSRKPEMSLAEDSEKAGNLSMPRTGTESTGRGTTAAIVVSATGLPKKKEKHQQKT
jgi:hypothetical protein